MDGNSGPPRFSSCVPIDPAWNRTTEKQSPPMIPRYSRPEMTAVWSPETRFRIWFEIEAYACEALAEIGVIPKEAARAIWEKGDKARFDVERIEAIERVTKHDV